MDERILTDEKCEMLFNSKYDGDFTFAFDNIADYCLIEKKLQMIRRYTNKVPKFYVLCGFDYNDKYDENFWYQDILDIFKRVELLMKYKCLPYIMRFNKYEDSPYRGMYINIGRWANQPSFFKKKSLYEFCTMECHINGATYRYLNSFLKEHPEFDKKYLNMKYEK